jgi:hypothetical protein
MELLKNKDMDNIPEPIKNVLDEAANQYATSPSTTNAGFVLRLICKFFKPSSIIKMFAHKISK